jgi:outer membrane protein TolC
MDNLKQTLGIPRGIPLALDPTPTYDYPEAVPYEQYLGIANDNRPELHVFDLREQQNEVSLLDAKDNLKDSLDFTAGVGINGEGQDFGKSLEDMEDINWTLGVEYLIPLGRDRRAKGQYEQARLALDQLALERAETETQIEADLSQAIRDVDVAEQRLAITATGVRVAQERLDNERARLDLGLTTATFVLEVEEDLAQARRSQIEADLDVVAARARLLNVLGLSQLAGNAPIDSVDSLAPDKETASP